MPVVTRMCHVAQCPPESVPDFSSRSLERLFSAESSLSKTLPSLVSTVHSPPGCWRVHSLNSGVFRLVFEPRACNRLRALSSCAWRLFLAASDCFPARRVSSVWISLRRSRKALMSGSLAGLAGEVCVGGLQGVAEAMSSKVPACTCRQRDATYGTGRRSGSDWSCAL